MIENLQYALIIFYGLTLLIQVGSLALLFHGWRDNFRGLPPGLKVLCYAAILVSVASILFFAYATWQLHTSLGKLGAIIQ